eukprot:2933917-Pyramimonas_sp.AAC.1
MRAKVIKMMSSSMYSLMSRCRASSLWGSRWLDVLGDVENVELAVGLDVLGDVELAQRGSMYSKVSRCRELAVVLDVLEGVET